MELFRFIVPPPPVFTHPLLTGSPIEERAYREAIANQCVKQSTLVAVVVEDRPEAGR